MCAAPPSLALRSPAVGRHDPIRDPGRPFGQPIGYFAAGWTAWACIMSFRNTAGGRPPAVE
jgi:hypothetical protein